jgi:hypothetical protein
VAIVRIASLIGVALLVMLTNVIASILYMVIYAHIIDTGHDLIYYQDHILVAGPFCSIVAGIPILFAAGWWVAGWWHQTLGVRGALCVWLAYTLIDLLVLLASGLSLGVGVLFVASVGTKLVAVCWGAITRLKKRAEP